MKILFCLIFSISLFADFEKTKYAFTKTPIDVVIPCHEKDQETLDFCIEGIRQNGQNIRRIIIVSSKPLTKKAEWFDEKKFPFSKQDLESIVGKTPRIGWLLQQLIKLYAIFVIPNISDNVLVLDADTVFLQPISFQDERGEPFFNIGKERHRPYFDHAKKLLPSFEKVFQNVSGITHHMLFQKPVLEDLFAHIENEHHIVPWKALLKCIDPKEAAPFSEYEIYFNFIFGRTDQAHIRPLKWKNSRSLHKLLKYKKKNFDYLSFHAYLQA